MSNAWSQLPNAHHIDWVIESLKTRPNIWSGALNASWPAVQPTSRDAARIAALDAVRQAARSVAWDAALGVALGVVRGSALGAMLALAAYDDCDEYLFMTYEELYVWSSLSELPQAILLLPMKWVQEHEQQSMVTPA